MTTPTDPASRKRKPRRIEPYTPAWNRMAGEVARGFCIIEPCRDCGGPLQSELDRKFREHKRLARLTGQPEPSFEIYHHAQKQIA